MAQEKSRERAEKLIKQMTEEEKLRLCLGKNGWYIGGIERLNIPVVEMRDGPHGLRKGSAKCYPNFCLTACSWDRELLRELGESLAGDFLKEHVGVVLGPGINIKRIPTCGRNFEYLSEDPLLTGELAAAFINGVQSRGVVACVKHFCCYNQEKNRFTYSAEVDEATLREIYLKAFEIVVKKSRPGMLMTSYNRLNGVYTAQDPKLLQEILREEWKYDGVVVSDWGGSDRRAEAFGAGLDLDMPGCGTIPDDVLRYARGSEGQKVSIDEHCRRILRLIERVEQGAAMQKKPEKTVSLRKAAAESMVLLKNENAVLPLRRSDKVAVIGTFAKRPRIQGGGSANVRAESIQSPFEEIAKYAECEPLYASGYGEGDETALLAQAQSVASAADKAIIFAGLDETAESEAYDRRSWALPEKQIKLIERVYAANRNVIVVLFNGGVVETASWQGLAAGVVEAYYAGQDTGGAVADILYGAVNPCGRLAETIPMRLEDSPAYLYYPGQGDKVYYGERLFVGYRYYVSKKQRVAYPFGYGLSYTSFAYSDFSLSAAEICAGDVLNVAVKLQNSGALAGKEVTQIYLADENGDGYPVLQLIDFQKTHLNAGESRTLRFHFTDEIFRRYDAKRKHYVLKPGNYRICLCKNSMEEIASVPVRVVAETQPFRIDRYTKIGEILQQVGGDDFCNSYLADAVKKAVYGDDDVTIKFEKSDVIGDVFCRNVVKSMPLRALITLSDGIITENILSELVKIYNNEDKEARFQRESQFA